MFSKIKEIFSEMFSDELTLDTTINVRELIELSLKKDWGLIQKIEEDTLNDEYTCNVKVNFSVPIKDLKDLANKVKRDICEEGEKTS